MRGFDEAKLLQYPTDKINLIYEHAKREEANDALVQLNAMHVAFASVMGDKDAFNQFKKLRDRLAEFAK